MHVTNGNDAFLCRRNDKHFTIHFFWWADGEHCHEEHSYGNLQHALTDFCAWIHNNAA